MSFLDWIFKKKETPIEEIPIHLQNIKALLDYVKQYKKLPIRIPKDVLNSLIVITNTSEWYNQLDQETTKNLNKIYDKWQAHIKTKTNTQAIKVGKAEGFERPKYWEGTWEEYERACQNNEIDNNTKVEIIEDENNYKGSWVSIDENGEIEEYME